MQPSQPLDTDQPGGTESSSRANLSVMARQSWAESAHNEGENNSLWISATSMLSSINVRYSFSQFAAETFEVDLHDLWFLYYHASMNTPDESTGQDRLVLQILQAREQGDLSRRDSAHAVIEKAITSDGVIWTDLPFLVPDMTHCWTTRCAAMSGSQRLNFSGFLARLASVGVVNDRLCGIGLIVLRDALETVRPLGELGDNENEDPGRTIDDLSVSALLPSANMWLFHARFKILSLAERSWDEYPPQVGGLGGLLLQDASDIVPSGGFSPQRWLYWLKRLQELVAAPTQPHREERKAVEYLSRITGNMLLTADERDSSFRAEVEAIRAEAGHQPPIQLLGPSLD